MIVMVNRFMTPQPQHQQIHRTEIEIPGIVWSQIRSMTSFGCDSMMNVEFQSNRAINLLTCIRPPPPTLIYLCPISSYGKEGQHRCALLC
jgi:hypothetical protein